MKVLALTLAIILMSTTCFAGVNETRAYDALGKAAKNLWSIAGSAASRTAQAKADGAALKTKYAAIYDAADEASMNAIGSAANTFQTACTDFQAAIVSEFSTVED